MKNSALAHAAPARAAPAHGALAGWMATVESRLDPLTAVVDDFTALTGVPIDVAGALFERAELAGFRLPAGISAGGSCQLLATADGWAAVNLARPDDHAALPALLALLGAPRDGLRTAAHRTAAAELVRSAQLLGMAAAALGSERGRRVPVRAERHGRPRLASSAASRPSTCPRSGRAPCAHACWDWPAPAS